MKTDSTSAVAIDPALARSVHNVAAQESGHSPTACLNCGTLVADRFCGHCGQDAHHTHRFTMRYLLLHDLPHSVWHVDKGVLYTLRQMLTRPGYAIAEYLAGRRAQHFRPVTYLLLIGGLGALLMSKLHLQPIPPDRAAEMPKVFLLAMDQYMSTIYKYPSLLYTVLLPINALLAWLLLRATRYNYTEMLIGQAFITGTLTIPSMFLMAPLMWFARTSTNLQSLSFLGMLPSLVYPVWVYLQLQANTPLSSASRWLRALSTSFLQLLVIMLAGIGFVFILITSMLRQDPSLQADLKAKLSKKPAATQVAPRR